MKEYIPHISDLIDLVIEGLAFLLPESILTIAFLISIFSGVFVKNNSFITWLITMVGLLLAGMATVYQLHSPADEPVFFDMILPDTTGAKIKILITLSGLLFGSFLFYSKVFKTYEKGIADLLSTLLALHVGMNLMAMSVNWLMTYIAVEMVSIGSYIMVGAFVIGKNQSEAAMKYVLFGAVCSAMMLYGISFLYGYTGSLSFTGENHLIALAEMPVPLLLFAMLLVLTGIGFKLSFVPFHFWSPDIYQGAATPVVALLSTAPKIAAIVLLARFVSAWSMFMMPVVIFYMLVFFAVASMVVGNFVAIRQHNLKRMMAYSSIGHTGFLMMIVLSGLEQSVNVLLYYLLIYTIMNMGVFMLASYFEERLGVVDVNQFRGLGKVYPTLTMAMTIFMVSLIGLPPTAGFIAKLLAFSAAWDVYTHGGDMAWLVLLATGAVTTVVALFFYFKIPLNAFLRNSEVDYPKSPVNGLVVIALLLSFFTLILGIFPSIMLN
ncbi:NADH-quinone oxidoreductase subunit N [Olivibacter sp. SDN3]|uniref:NADH-quinone oxidoreductase subunit N n=1 Tax=Olivibacter sp. SDN3 TaxID=2764720 RepID=UPI001650EEDF|nr:NADH-quinone oxidoreductase subunit N [Olivibacter sp. SDN3]QNL52123.1 NADH-quinone oxidoreductase subunit N [Olivibacter sp. SDN3]